jgi:acetolactate synthase-1/2/3 large subunit
VCRFAPTGVGMGVHCVARLGEHIPRLLSSRGFEVAFGMPSLPTIEIARGFEGSGLHAVGVRDMAHAGFMADGYARVSGLPAVCIAHHGPGLTALATPAAQALADSVPMLILATGQPATPDGRRGGHRHTLRDPAALIGTVCVAHHRVREPAALPEALDRAVESLHRGRPGPVCVEVPEAVLAREAGQIAETELAKPPPLPEMTLPAPAMIAEIVIRLAEAERPVLILGGGAVAMGAAAARALAERLGAAVLMTTGGRGLLPGDHPCTVGSHLSSPPVRALLAEADAVLAIGTELSPEEWGLQEDERLATRSEALIRVDIDPDRLYQTATPALPLACDARALIDPVLESLPQGRRPLPDHRALRQRAAASMPHGHQRHRDLIDAIWEHLPEAVVFGDPCEPVRAGLSCALPPAPRRWLTGAAGFGAAGHALPAAVGAKIADPRRPVIALMGDTAVTGVLSALATAADANAHVVLMVWNNTGFGEVRDAMQAAHVRAHGADVKSVDLQPIARGLGAAYARVHGPDYFREALRSAIMRPGPTILELREDYWFG